MKLRELVRFRRTQGGVVPIEVVERLCLPMPPDVLEQFVLDHGLNEDFQAQYGSLELHAIQWTLKSLSGSGILACSAYTSFARHIDAVAKEVESLGGELESMHYITRQSKQYWLEKSTWLRSPIFLDGPLAGSGSPLHLVEGHTRTGVLRGLVTSRKLPSTLSHSIWVGEPAELSPNSEVWREVLAQDRMPFLDWLMGQMGEPEEAASAIASRLLHVQYSFAWMSLPRVRGDDLPAVLEFARQDPELGPLVENIQRLHEQWVRFTQPEATV